MEDLLLYSDIDQFIQDNMGNRYPDVDKRMRAINSELESLRTKYNIFTSRMKVIISVKTDGSQSYDINSLITDDDVEDVLDLRMNNNSGYSFVKVSETTFNRDLELGKVVNEYTLFYESGELKIKVLSIDNSSDAQDLECVYFSRALGEKSDGTKLSSMTRTSGEVVYIPYKYKKLVAFGAMKDLWYQAVGDDSEKQYIIVSNKYKGEKNNLGLSDDAEKAKKHANKVKIKSW